MSRGDGVATDADAKPQKNVPQAEHMPHVMPRARSSKSSGRVRQMRQRSEEHGSGCGCWCSGAAWVDGWAAFGAFPTAGALTIAAFVTAGDAWMLALRESVEWVCVGVLMANMMVSMHLCARARMYTLSKSTCR